MNPNAGLCVESGLRRGKVESPVSMSYHDKIFLAPLAERRRPARKQEDEHGIGRSPRFVPGWWLAGAALFYAAVAMVCVLILA